MDCLYQVPLFCYIKQLQLLTLGPVFKHSYCWVCYCNDYVYYNHRHTSAVRVKVLGLSVCLSVCSRTTGNKVAPVQQALEQPKMTTFKRHCCQPL